MSDKTKLESAKRIAVQGGCYGIDCPSCFLNGVCPGYDSEIYKAAQEYLQDRGIIAEKEKKPYNFKSGDKAVIIADNFNHNIPIDEVVEIVKVDPDGILVFYLGHSWWVSDGDTIDIKPYIIEETAENDPENGPENDLENGPENGPENDLENDPVNSPAHYKNRIPGIEAIEVTEHFNFNRGNAIKYIWRAGSKGDMSKEIEDLKKARWYIDREVKKMENNNN
jgi:hypothetical protein